MSIPAHPVEATKKRRRGTTRKRRHTDSASENSDIFSEYQSKRSSKKGGTRKPRKRENIKGFNGSSNDISIADLVSLYDNKKVPEDSDNDKYMRTYKKSLNQDNNSKDSIEQFEDSSEELTTLSILREDWASRVQDVVVDDEENESSESDGKSNSIAMENFNASFTRSVNFLLDIRNY